MPVELAQFGQQAQEGAGQGGPDAGHALQRLVLHPPDGTGLDRCLEHGIGIDHLALEPADMGVETAPDDPAAGPGLALPLGMEHLEQLPAPGEQGLELLGGRIG
jgi:hypothetical protein